MATNSNNLEVTRLRVRKTLKTTEEHSYPRGTYVWGKINQAHWPGIVVTPEDVHAKEQNNHYAIFWFGYQRISNVLRSGVELFAINFSKHYKEKSVPLWKKAISESLTHYGHPYTAGMEYDALIKFACSNQLQEIDCSSHLQELPEFVQLKIYSRNVFMKEQVAKSKKLRQIQYTLPHVIESTCVACVDPLDDNEIPHPLFVANLCKQCAQKLKEVLYIMIDGIYEHCFICGNPKNIQCKKRTCEATYCNFCIKTFWAHNVTTSIKFCILCSSLMAGLIRPRPNYIFTSCLFMLTDETNIFWESAAPIKLQPFDISSKDIVKVVTLFHGFSTGIETVFPLPFNVFLSNKCNNLQQNYQPTSASNEIKQIQQYFNNSLVRLVSMTSYETVQIHAMHMQIDRKVSEKFRDVMLIVGGTNILKNTIKHFRQNSFIDLLTEFWRVVHLIQEQVDVNMKWIFEMPFTLDYEEINFISRYLDCQSNIIGGSNQKYCYIWSNISMVR